MTEPEHNTAALEQGGDVDATANGQADYKRPDIQVNDRHLDQVTADAWNAIQKRQGNAPRLFRFGTYPARIEHDDNGQPVVKPLNVDGMRNELAESANWYKTNNSAVSPPLDVTKNVLATANLPLPILQRVVEVPVFAPDGTINPSSGYHEASRTYYEPKPGFTAYGIPTHPTREQIETAKQWLFEELLFDFPFVGSSDRAHAVAVMLLPFVRSMINGPTPMHLIGKPKAGTGSNLLAEVLLYPSLGHTVPSMTEERNESEMRKRITSVLRRGPSAVLYSNLHYLGTSALEEALTAPMWEDRILGHTRTMTIPIKCVWVGTGNNPELSADMPRRIVPINLDAQQEKPWLRPVESFKHPDLREWSADSRSVLVFCCHILIQSWISAGKPEGTKTLGSYEGYSRVVGGILDVVGIDGFLDNLRELYEQADSADDPWWELITRWWNTFGDKPVTISQLEMAVSARTILDLGPGSDKGFQTKMGLALLRKRGQIFRDHRIEMIKDRRPREYRLAHLHTFGEVN